MGVPPFEFGLRERNGDLKLYKPRLEMTRETSSTPSSSITGPPRGYPWMFWVPMTGDRADLGGPYTLGNEGAVGLELPVSPIEFAGESGRESSDLNPAASVMRESEKVRSSD